MNHWPYIIAVVATISPVICSLITTRANVRQRAKELYYENEVSAYRLFANRYGEMQTARSKDTICNFIAAAHQAAILCPEDDIRKQIFEIIALVSQPNMMEQANLKFQDCISKLAKICSSNL